MVIVTVLGLVGGAPAQGWGGDTARRRFIEVQTATQPVVPPHAVREGQVVHGSITDEEKHCLDLRFSTRIIAVVDIVLSVLNVIFGSFWALIIMKIGEHRAKEVDDHHNYDAKCACMP